MTKQAKILKLNDDKGLLEGNLMEIPFINYNKKSDVRIIEYTWIDSDNNKRGIEVRASAKHGLPSPAEFDVLCAFFRLYFKKRSTYHNYQYTIEDYVKENNEKRRYINFNVTELAREMGYACASGQIINNIRNSIECLVETTLYSRFEGGLLDVKTNKYKRENRTKAFHILNGFESVEYKRNNHTTYEVEIDDFFFQSVTHNYFNYYSVPLLQSITDSVAKKMFFIMTKWRNNRQSMVLYHNTLFDRIPLPEDMPRHRKNQKLRRGYQNLKDYGFIENFIMEKEHTDITFPKNEIN